MSEAAQRFCSLINHESTVTSKTNTLVELRKELYEKAIVAEDTNAAKAQLEMIEKLTRALKDFLETKRKEIEMAYVACSLMERAHFADVYISRWLDYSQCA